MTGFSGQRNSSKNNIKTQLLIVSQVQNLFWIKRGLESEVLIMNDIVKMLKFRNLSIIILYEICLKNYFGVENVLIFDTSHIFFGDKVSPPGVGFTV